MDLSGTLGEEELGESVPSPAAVAAAVVVAAVVGVLLMEVRSIAKSTRFKE